METDTETSMSVSIQCISGIVHGTVRFSDTTSGSKLELVGKTGRTGRRANRDNLMVVAEVVVLRAFLIIEDNASFETRKLFNETRCWSCRASEVDGDSS